MVLPEWDEEAAVPEVVGEVPADLERFKVGMVTTEVVAAVVSLDRSTRGIILRLKTLRPKLVRTLKSDQTSSLLRECRLRSVVSYIVLFRRIPVARRLG